MSPLSCPHTLRMRMLIAVVFAVWILSPHLMPNSLLLPQAFTQNIPNFTKQVSSRGQTNATEPSVAVDRSDGTVYVAWQASGTHVARSDNGGRTFVETPIANLFGSDVGDVDVRVGGPTPSGTHRVYVSSLEELPLVLQTHVAYSDDRGASWTINNLAAVNPSFIDRPWLAVFASKASANLDQVYISYHDFSASQINVTASNDGGQTFGPSVDVIAQNGMAETQSFCNTVPSGIEVDPETGEVYVKWITADPVANTTQGCNITQIESFHQVWIAHSPPANASTLTVWDAHLVFGTHFFPWIAAGTTGRVDFIWLSTPDLSPSDAALSPWTAIFGQTTNGTSATPSFSQTSASNKVMHVGGICTDGIFCSVSGGNRDLADSISITIDRGGSAALVWTDQGSVLNGPTHITYGCIIAGQSALAGAKRDLSCKGPAGP